MVRLLDYGFEPNGTIVPPFTAINIYPIGGATITPDFSPPNSGNVAMKITIPPSSAWAGGLLNFDLASTYTELWARCYVNISNLSSLASGMMVYVSRFYSITPISQEVVRAGIVNNGTTLAWRLTTRNGTNYVSASDVAVTQTSWVCVEIHVIAGASGSAELYINGTLVSQITGVNNATYPVNSVRFGCDRPANATQTVTVGIDDVAVDTVGPIGPISIVNPKITVNSSPEINVPVYVDGVLAGNTPLVVSVPSGTHTVRVDTEVTR